MVRRFSSSRRPLLVTFVLAGLAAATALGGGCTTSTSPATGGDDGGGGGDSNSPGADSSTSDGSITVDGATDAGPGNDVDGSTCPTALTHLPAGFTQVVASPGADAILTGAGGARPQQMVLDENDDPMFAYASEDSSTSWSINFTRWDACAGQFTAPVTVATLHPGAQPDLSLGYDPTTKEVGVAFVMPSTVNDWADDFGEIWLGTMKTPATAFTLQQLTIGDTDENGTGAPSIAMGGGQIYIGYWDGTYLGSYGGLVWLLSLGTTPSGPTTAGPPYIPDGGTGDASVATQPLEDAGTPPHYFNYEAMPYGGPGSFGGYAWPLGSSASISVAIDSAGVPGVAAYQVGSDYGKTILFWRPNMQQAVAVSAFQVDDGVDLALAFEGTKPRIAGHMVSPTEADAATEAPDSLMFFASDDGITWSPGVNLPSNNGSQYTAATTALALDGMGNAAIASHTNTSSSPCGGDPYLATSSDEDDGGAAWTACGVDTTDVHRYGAYSISALYGANRLKGTLTLSFVSEASAVTDAGADQAGLIYWQHP